jgi:hypothetical protein
MHCSGADHANANGSDLPPKSLASHTGELVSPILMSGGKDPRYQWLSQGEMLRIFRQVECPRTQQQLS